jgi:UDP-N-acetyl-D-mannosaminuronic acid transferase (WecB/TagA/CpsF family)
MNHTLYIVISILLFAVATAVLYVIGLRKKLRENENLVNMLLNNGTLRVKKYLKDHDTITADGIGYIIKDVKAKEFYSKKVATIRNGADFQAQLIDYMLRNNYVTADTDANGETVYRLPVKGEAKNE